MVPSETKKKMRWKKHKKYSPKNIMHGVPEWPPETEVTKSMQYGKKKRKIPDTEWMAAAWGLKGKCTKVEYKWKKQS